MKSLCKADSNTFEHQALRVFGSDSRSRPRFEIGLAYPGEGDDTLLVEQRGRLTPRLSDESRTGKSTIKTIKTVKQHRWLGAVIS